jgi:hypothetical protein
MICPRADDTCGGGAGAIPPPPPHAVASKEAVIVSRSSTFGRNIPVPLEVRCRRRRKPGFVLQIIRINGACRRKVELQQQLTWRAAAQRCGE